MLMLPLWRLVWRVWLGGKYRPCRSLLPFGLSHASPSPLLGLGHAAPSSLLVSAMPLPPPFWSWPCRSLLPSGLGHAAPSSLLDVLGGRCYYTFDSYNQRGHSCQWLPSHPPDLLGDECWEALLHDSNLALPLEGDEIIIFPLHQMTALFLGMH